MSDDKRHRLSPNGTNADWDHLVFVHTLRLSNAKSDKERAAAERELKAVQRSAALVKKGRRVELADTGPSFHDELITDLKTEDDGLRPDQRFTEPELRERFGTGQPCAVCGEETWDVGHGPHCCCTGVPTPAAPLALPSGNEEPF